MHRVFRPHALTRPLHRPWLARGLALLGCLLMATLVSAETITAFEMLDPATVERAAMLSINDTAAKQASATSTQAQYSLSVRAFGQEWQWQVTANTRLLATVPAQQRKKWLTGASLWQGRSPQNPQAWLRFSLWNNPVTGQTEWHGLWWDGAEFYRIAPAHATALASHFEKLGQSERTLVYRLSDVVADARLACGVNDADDADNFQPLATDHYRDLFSELDERWKSAQSDAAASSQLNVAIVADTYYQSQWGSNTTASILNLMNNVDGIYSNQIGVTLNISQILVLNDNGPMTATDSGVLLPQFRDWVGAGNLNNPGLAHLFTSRNLDGNIKGRAYVNVLCAGQWGTGIDEIVGNSYETIIVAHEIGHNFGADHDGDAAGSCPNEPANTYIMSPVVSASYTSFSPCSQNILVNNAAAAACITPVANDLIFAHGFE